MPTESRFGRRMFGVYFLQAKHVHTYEIRENNFACRFHTHTHTYTERECRHQTANSTHTHTRERRTRKKIPTEAANSQVNGNEYIKEVLNLSLFIKRQ